MTVRLQYCQPATRLSIAVIFIAVICGWLVPQSAAAQQRLSPSSNRECAICHIMWLDEFKRQDVAPLVPYEPLPLEASGRQDVSSTDRMCFSCHDGFVLDSRFLWKHKGHGHPVGIEPSDEITIPTAEGKEVFPLNADGKLYCGTCHSAHSIDWKEKDRQTIFLRLENRNSNLCTACHLDRVTGSGKDNHPVQKKLTEIPEALVEAGSRFGDRGEMICQSCHLSHGARQPRMLARPIENSELCASCHAEQARVIDTKHDLTIVAPDSTNGLDRQVAKSGPCSACHTPHRARGPTLWSRLLHPERNLGSAYCLSCHEKNGLAPDKAVGAHSHPMDVPLRRVGVEAKKEGWLSQVKSPAAPDNLLQLPLFDRQGNRLAEGGNITCLTCHDPHRWSADHTPRGADEIREQDGDGSNSFLRIANDRGSALCVNCHVAQAAVTFSKHNLDISAPREPNKDGMNAIRSGVCSACHLPHNGNGDKMWARSAARGESAISAKCLNCHSKDQVAAARTVGRHSHPLLVEPGKAGAGGDLPLFRKDGKKDDRQGLIDCMTCHDPHQWDPRNELARSGIDPEFDGHAGNSFLRKHASGDAELCVDCHRDQAALLGTDHDLAVTAAEGLNSRGLDVARSGPCGQCHAVHQADLARHLWAQPLGDGEPAADRLCTGCHSQAGVARQKVPLELDHPPRVLSASAGRTRRHAGQLVPPLFSADGKTTEVGMISCLTCHDPHRWKAGKHDRGSGVNLEGDVSNSFLRHASSENFICADCHAEESLLRYKYYHWPKSRPFTEPEDY